MCGRTPVSIREWRELPSSVTTTRRRVVEYLVKWRGSGPKYTWERGRALPKDMIDRFHSIKSIYLKGKPFAVTPAEFVKFGNQTTDFVASVQAHREQQSAPPIPPRTPTNNTSRGGSNVMEIVPLDPEAAEEEYLAFDRAILKCQRMIDRMNGSRPPVTIVNDVDFKHPPSDFIYISTPIYGKDAPQQDPRSTIGCGCASDSCGANCPCSGSYRNGLLLVSNSRILRECNSRCPCGPQCPNRLVQRGRQYSLTIYYISPFIEWGVRADTFIPKNSFIEEYVGEIITMEESFLKLDHEYMFDLDIDCEYGEESAFTVDARRYGNATRFINHSCDPNLRVLAVVIDCQDTRLHGIAFFTARDIQPGEQLTFDYSGLTDFESNATATTRGRKKRKKAFTLKGAKKKEDTKATTPNSLSTSPRAGTSTLSDRPCFCGSAKCRQLIIPFVS